MEKIHNVFHIYQLRKYVPDPSCVLSYPPEQIHEDLSYTEEPVQILDHNVKQLRNKTIPLVKDFGGVKRLKKQYGKLKKK